MAVYESDQRTPIKSYFSYKHQKVEPARTGNLETELVITTDHSKQKYKDDGIMNGARGYVQAITVSKDDPEKVGKTEIKL